MSGPFATATELCEFSGIPIPSDLARIQALLDAASAEIRGYIGQLGSGVVNETVVIQPQYNTLGQVYPLPSSYGEILLLPERPVTTVSSITWNGAAFTAFGFTSAGVLYRTDGRAWAPYPATVVYNHGYAETTDEYGRLKTVCIQAALRAFTLNERSASEALGSTLMESAGYSPEVFLTEGEKMKLPNPGKALFG